MTGSIICGVDDSVSAKGAARVAAALSARLGSRLVFVHVVHDGSSDDEVAAVAAALRQLAATAADDSVRWLVEVGHPADRLVTVAQKEAASLVVVGSTGPRASPLGSISADVSRRAPCPVVVVAPGAEASLVNGNGRTPAHRGSGFPGLFGEGDAGPAVGFDAAWQRSTPDGGDAATDSEARSFAGGILRLGRG